MGSGLLIKDSRHLLELIKNVSQKPLLLWIERPFAFLFEQLSESDHCMEGSAQFMAHAGQEFAFEAGWLFLLQDCALPIVPCTAIVRKAAVDKTRSSLERAFASLKQKVRRTIKLKL